MDNKPEVRVIVPCRNADSTLEKCLRAIRQSNDVDIELVLVDDGGTTSLRELADKYGAEIRSSNGTHSAGAARNAGADSADRKILVFIDADVEVENDAVRKLIDPILSGYAHASVGRYGNDITGLNFAQSYKQLYLCYKYGVDSGQIQNQFWTALGAVGTNVFHELDGFREDFTGAGPEDIELGIRLTGAGHTILAVPGAKGKHLAFYTPFSLILNDLRKGSEDIYIHWMNNVSLNDNRHAEIRDMIAVFLSGVFLMAVLLRRPSKQLMAVMISWIIVRFPLLRAVSKAGFASRPFTFALDLVRGFAVVLGSLAAAVETLSKGKVKPFQRLK